MNKDSQYIEHGIETRNSISYEHNKRIFNCRMLYFTTVLYIFFLFLATVF